MKYLAGLLLALVVLVPAGAETPTGFLFKNGDRIVFLGDSITEQYEYSSDIELYLTTRFPKWRLTFINAGIGGDTANGGASRFQNHVLAEKPTVMTINFGMNDGGYGAFDANRNKQYKEKTKEMLEMAKKAGVRVGLVSPNAVDRRVAPRFKLYLETQKEFYAPLKEIAGENGAVFVDQYATTRSALEKMEQDDPMASKARPFGDGFHTSSPGGMLMAHAILTGLGAPALVSDVEIDAAGGTAKANRCKVQVASNAATGITFERTDDALPIPVQASWLSTMPYMNNLKDLNWYGLKVTGLATGSYKLTIDGKDAATFTTEQLASGVNLGSLTTGPIHEQGQKVFNAINEKNRLVHRRFRDVVMFNAPDWLADVATERKAAELAKRTEKIDALQAEVYKLVQPTPHKFELKQAK